MSDISYNYVVVTPNMGEVSCANRTRAKEYSSRTNGKPFSVRLENGREVSRSPI